MLLGLECDSDTAYFMKHGRYPMPNYDRKITFKPIYDREYEREQYENWLEENDMQYFSGRHINVLYR